MSCVNFVNFKPVNLIRLLRCVTLYMNVYLRYEREEEFYSIPVTVKCHTLESSLEQFVNDEVMEGENAYYCEKCRESVSLRLFS